MVSQNKLYLLHFKLESLNENMILKYESIYPCIVLKPLVFTCAAFCTRNFQGMLVLQLNAFSSPEAVFAALCRIKV